jgi:uncharacterized membrane protein
MMHRYMPEPERPHFDLPLTLTDRLLEGFAVVVLLALIALPVYYFDQLPDNLPKHYDLQGRPDGWSHKSGLFLLPAIGLGLYILLTVLNRNPQNFNYLSKITPENAPYQYRNASRMIRVLKLMQLLLFLYLVVAVIRGGLGVQSGLGTPFVLLFVLSISFVALWFIVRSAQVQK